jgi:hypothetical protein
MTRLGLGSESGSGRRRPRHVGPARKRAEKGEAGREAGARGRSGPRLAGPHEVKGKGRKRATWAGSCGREEGRLVLGRNGKIGREKEKE